MLIGTEIRLDVGFAAAREGLGADLDRVVMNRIARASIRAFARQIGAALTAAHVLPAAADGCWG